MPISENSKSSTNITEGDNNFSECNPEMVPYSQLIKISILIKNNSEIKMSKNQKTEKPVEKIHYVMLTIDSSFYSSNIVKSSLDLFNNIFEEGKDDYRLSLNYENYKLKPSKKNGKPNMDYPCIDKESTIKDTGIVNFSIIYKEEDLIKIQKKTQCCKCSIF